MRRRVSCGTLGCFWILLEGRSGRYLRRSSVFAPSHGEAEAGFGRYLRRSSVFSPSHGVFGSCWRAVFVRRRVSPGTLGCLLLLLPPPPAIDSINCRDALLYVVLVTTFLRSWSRRAYAE